MSSRENHGLITRWYSAGEEQRGAMPTPLNECCACGEDFASLAAFDAHILSKPADADFDCLQEFELRRKRWVKDSRGRWTTPLLAAQADRMGAGFRKAA